MGHDARNEMWVVMALGIAGLGKATCELDFERAEDGSVRGTFTFDASLEWQAAKLLMYLIHNTQGPVTGCKGTGSLAAYHVSFNYPPFLEDPIEKAKVAT